MGDTKVNHGLLISLVIHILIMAMPVSMAVVHEFKEIELFVIDDEKPVIQETKVVKKEKTSEVPKVIKPEIKEIERHQRMDETNKLEEKIIEPSTISNKVDSIALTDLPKAEVLEVETAHPIDVGFGSVRGPNFLHRELPVYPMLARRIGKEGRIVLRLTIDERGNLLNVEVIEKAGYGFTEAAIEAVKRSTFLPAKKDGKSIASWAILPIRFTLRRD